MPKPVYDFQKCKKSCFGCCIFACAKACILLALNPDRLEFKPEKCNGCGECASACKSGAIIMKEEK